MSAAPYVSEELKASVRRMCSSPRHELAAAYETGQIETVPAAGRNRSQIPSQERWRQLRARRRRQRSPDRQRSYERRHRLAWSGPLPGFLAGRLTIGDMAVARIIVDEHQRRGFCDKSIDEIAASAGVCRKTAKRAMRRLRFERLISVEERPIRGRKSLTNLVRIISPEWKCWLEKRMTARSINEGMGAVTTSSSMSTSLRNVSP
jgi:hypothetical protein